MNLPEEEPVIAQRYLAADVRSTSWADARRLLAEADTYWLATVHSNGRSHLVPVLAVWLDDALHFVASRTSSKAKNLARDSQGAAFSVSEVGPGA